MRNNSFSSDTPTAISRSSSGVSLISKRRRSSRALQTINDARYISDMIDKLGYDQSPAPNENVSIEVIQQVLSDCLRPVEDDEIDQNSSMERSTSVSFLLETTDVEEEVFDASYEECENIL